MSDGLAAPADPAASAPPFLDGPGDMVRRVAELDWAASPIGPMQRWPASLRTAVGICLASRHPMVIGWGPQLVQIYNDAWVPILGPAKHPALGAPAAQVWPEIWHIVGEQLAGVLRTGEATWSEDQLLPVVRRGYPEEAYFTYSHSPIRDESGRVGGVLTAATETTDRVLGERRLATLHRLGETSAATAVSDTAACAAALRVLTENPADVPAAVVYLLDEDGRSARRAAAFGMALDHPAVPEVLPGDDTGRAVWRVARTGRSKISTDLQRRRPGLFTGARTTMGAALPDTVVALPVTAAGADAPVAVLQCAVSPHRALDEDYLAFFELVAGQLGAAIGDTRALATQRRRAEALAELDRAKTEFFTGISHEFRTPLTLIRSPVRELLGGDLADPGRLRTELASIDRNAGRLVRLVDNLLDFSRVQAGRAQARFAPVDLSAVTADLASMFRAAVERAGLTFVVEVADIGEPVWVDRQMWEKVVLNLLSNALKYTLDGSVAVTLRRVSDAAVLAVTDTGAGIAADELPRLFDRFHRVAGSTGRSAEGSGIGLALTSELVGLHGGTVDVASQVGTGSTFTVRVPLGNAHLPAEQLAPAPSGAAPVADAAEAYVTEALRWLVPGDVSTGSAAPHAPQRSASVLVVDDNADMRAYLTRLLEPQYVVRTAQDGLAARAAARADPPDLVVTDVMMPGIDGFGLLTALRDDPRTATVPVIVLSARAGEEAAIEGLAAGADDYLVKPFAAAELLARIRSLLALARARGREARWRAALIEAMQDGFSLVDLDADPPQLVEMNDAFTAILGYGRDRLPCTAPFPWWPDPATHPDEYRESVRSLADGASGRHTLPMRHRDGHVVWAAIVHAVLADPETGRRVRVSTIRDVTAERAAARRAEQLADEQLREADAAFRLLSEHTDDVVGRHEADGRWSYVSPSVHRMSGWLPAQLVGRSPLELIHPDDRVAVRDLADRLRHGPAEALLRLRRADGSYLWLETRGRLVTNPDTGRTEVQTVSRDVHARVLAEAALHAERERYRALVEQVDVGIFRTDRRGWTEFVNERLTTLFGRPRGQLLGLGWLRHLHPGDRDRVRRESADATAARRAWSTEYRTGGRRLRTTAQPLHDPSGEFLGYLGTCLDVTELHAAEEDRRRVATAQAARRVADAAAARMQALVSGLAAIVWEGEPGVSAYTFVTERVTDLLGYPIDAWVTEPGIWSTVLHPEDRAEVLAQRRAAVGAGRDHEQTYRVIAADGRVVWLHDVVHVACDEQGVPRTLQGVLLDVTEQHRAEEATALLARLGRAQTGPGRLTDQLDRMARETVGMFADLAVVELTQPDGRRRPVVAAAPARPELEPGLLAVPATSLPEIVRAASEAGTPFVVQAPSEELFREAGLDGEDLRERLRLGVQTALVVPLRAADRPLGHLALLSLGRARSYDAADLELAAEVGRRMAVLVEARQAGARERELQRITVALAAADSLREVAAVLVDGVEKALGATTQTLYVVDAELGRLQVAHGTGYRAEILDRFATIGFADAVPHAQAARTGAAVWINDGDGWADFPGVAEPAPGDCRLGAFALPLQVGGRVIAVLGAGFPTVRRWTPDEREFALTIASAAAQAVQRSLDDDRRRGIAETLQHSLLPPAPASRDRLAVASRYLPGVVGVEAGGDWYDVVPLGAHRTAVVVGDVVGQGARAAALMGQLRSALSAILRVLDRAGPVRPAEALALLNGHAATMSGARGSTALCLVVDTAAGRLCWARAGHPPPLLVPAQGPPRFLDGGAGPLLGAYPDDGTPGPYTEGVADLGVGDTVVLYTDGLVERRGEVLDDGMDRMLAALAGRPAGDPDALVDGLLAAAVPGGHAHDDVALIAVRCLPPPLHETWLAVPEQLTVLRRRVARWAEAAALAEDVVDDLLLAVGEAAANSAEHAYPADEPGEVTCLLRYDPAAGTVEGRVADHGTWRPPPADRGYRGRGLELIERMCTGSAVEHGSSGTTVRFMLTTGRAAAPAEPAAPVPALPHSPGGSPAVLAVVTEPDARRIALRGDLDLATVDALRADVLAAVASADGARVLLDLHAISYLSSAGIGLLLEVADHAERTGQPLRLDYDDTGPVGRLLAASGTERLTRDRASR